MYETKTEESLNDYLEINLFPFVNFRGNVIYPVFFPASSIRGEAE